MNERLEHLLFLVRYSTRVEINLPYLVDMNTEYEEDSLQYKYIKAMEYLKRDGGVKVTLLSEDKEDIETKILIEVV